MVDLNGDTTPLPVCPEDGNREDEVVATRQEILNQITEIKHKAGDIANALRLRPSSLLPLPVTMERVITEWLNHSYNVDRFGPPSWNMLIKAVADDNGGANKALAKRLAKIYPQGTYSVEKPSVTTNMGKPEQEKGTPPSRTSSIVSTGSSSSFGSDLTSQVSQRSDLTSQVSQPIPETSDELDDATLTNTTTSTGRGSTTIATSIAESEESSSNRVDVTANNNRGSDYRNFQEATPGTLVPSSRREEIDHYQQDQQDETSFVSDDGLFTKKIVNSSTLPAVKAPLEKEHLPPPPLVPYKMRTDGLHGYALVINNIEIDKREKRLGAEHDGTKLSHTLTNLGYKLVGDTVHKNCTAYSIEGLIQKATNMDHSDYDSFICCLMSHGDSGYIYGTDDKRVYLTDIQQEVIKCKSLVGKPKIFFIQACRGGNLPDARVVQMDDDGSQTSKIILPEACDVFFGFATSPSTKACRFTNEGSWYIIELCKAFQNYPNEDLMTIVQVAHHEVSTGSHYVYTRDEDRVQKHYRQSPQLVSTLIKKVYFNSTV